MEHGQLSTQKVPPRPVEMPSDDMAMAGLDHSGYFLFLENCPCHPAFANGFGGLVFHHHIYHLTSEEESGRKTGGRTKIPLKPKGETK